MDVVAGIDLSGKRAIVTGAASGIGIETARALASAGAEVTIAARDMGRAAEVAADITTTTGNEAILVSSLELNDRGSIDALAAGWEGPLHILVNNAGVMALPELELTPEGWERQFATNHLGHFALTVGLHDALAAAGNARIVSVSSRAHLQSPVVFEDIHFSSRAYNPWLAYGQSKTANVLLAVEATRRWGGEGITANSLHPGAIAETNLSRHIDPETLERARTSGRYNFKTSEQGAATSALVASSPLLEGIGGRYFDDCNEAVLQEPGSEPSEGVMPYALDPEAAERLWEVSLELLG